MRDRAGGRARHPSARRTKKREGRRRAHATRRAQGRRRRTRRRPRRPGRRCAGNGRARPRRSREVDTVARDAPGRRRARRWSTQLHTTSDAANRVGTARALERAALRASWKPRRIIAAQATRDCDGRGAQSRTGTSARHRRERALRAAARMRRTPLIERDRRRAGLHTCTSSTQTPSTMVWILVARCSSKANERL